MNPLSILWIEIIQRPIFNLLLVLLAVFGGNLWRAVIVLTLIIRLLLVRNAMAATKMQSQMTDFHPKMQEIQEKYKDDPQKQWEEMMNLFKKSWGWPLKGCLSMLVQIPVFLGLFFTVRAISTWTIPAETYSFLYMFAVDLESINSNFYGMDLLTASNVILTVAASVLMFFQMKITMMIKPWWWAPKLPWMDKEWMPDMSKMMWMMNYFFVAMMWAFVWSMPAAIWLYVVTTTLFWVVQQWRQYWPVIRAKTLAAVAKK